MARNLSFFAFSMFPSAGLQLSELVLPEFEKRATLRLESSSWTDDCLKRCGRTVNQQLNTDYCFLLLVIGGLLLAFRGGPGRNKMTLICEVCLLGRVAAVAEHLIRGTGWLASEIRLAHRMKTSNWKPSFPITLPNSCNIFSTIMVVACRAGYILGHVMLARHSCKIPFRVTVQT